MDDKELTEVNPEAEAKLIMALEAQQTLITGNLTDEEARDIVLKLRSKGIYFPMLRARGYNTVYGKYALHFAVAHPNYFNPNRAGDLTCTDYD